MPKPEEEKMLTLLVTGKPGVNIPLKRYNLMRDTLLGILAEYPEIGYKEMTSLTQERLKGMLDGSIMWLTETVKNDLMGRGIIEKTSQTPVRLRIVEEKD